MQFAVFRCARMCSRLAFAILLSFSCLFPLLQDQVSESTFSTSLTKSKRVSRILKEAQAGERPIRIVEFDGGHASPYSGETDFKPDQIVVRIDRTLPVRTGENNLVHELFHIILFKEGFRYTAGSYKFNLPGDVGQLYTSVAKTLTSCYADPLIDRRMIKRRFEPYLVTEISADGLASAEPSAILQSSQVEHWTEYFAMELYCLSLRPGSFKMEDVEKNWTVNPLIIKKETNFREQLGACDTPDNCFERMKSLRNAAGFESDIFIMNPQTGNYE